MNEYVSRLGEQGDPHPLDLLGDATNKAEDIKAVIPIIMRLDGKIIEAYKEKQAKFTGKDIKHKSQEINLAEAVKKDMRSGEYRREEDRTVRGIEDKPEDDRIH